MADIFISYARSTAAQAQAIAQALRALGYGVWRDDELPAHRAYAEVIEERLKAAKAVVVVWSAEAAKSEWVRSEADRARNDRKLVQLSVDGTPLPMPFDQTQCADLSGWTGDLTAPGWRKIIASIADLVGSAARALAPVSQNERAGVSICVLPFANMSDDKEQEYFSDGISEDIITDLSKVSALHVISRNSAFTFKGKHVDLPQVAKQLNVSHVLEGSVRKSGNRVRITAQLIDGASNGHVWAERYDRNLDDIFALQDEISEAIVKALKLKLFPAEKKAIEERGTTNIDAYDFYLKGQAAARGNGAEAYARASEFYRQAVAIDPQFTLAWTGLSVAALGVTAFSPDQAAKARAGAEMRQALERALSLAPNGAVGLMLQARRATLVDRDIAAAGRAAVQIMAIAKDRGQLPQAVGADLAGCGQLIANYGYTSPAIDIFKAISVTDPLSLTASSQLQYNLDIAGRYDEAEAEYQRTKELPGEHSPWEFQRLSRLWVRGAAPDLVRAQFERYMTMSSGFLPFASELFSLIDQPAAALVLLHRAFADAFYQDATRLNLIAYWAAHFGDTDLVLTALRRAYVDQRGALMVTLWHPLYAPARKDPRFKAILRDIGLVKHWRETGKWGDYVRPLGDDDFGVLR